MRTRISTLRKHFRAMSEARHQPTCPTLTEREPYWTGWALSEDGNQLRWLGPKPDDWWTPPQCDGCLTHEDRALFAALADEVEAYEEQRLPGVGAP